MDSRTTSSDFYPGGKTAISAGGITPGEGGNGYGEPMVPVTKVEELPERYRESDMRNKINELARVVSGGVAVFAAIVSLALGAAEPVKVQGAKKDALWNDDFVVTNVEVDLSGFATTGVVLKATKELEAAMDMRLSAATGSVLRTSAEETAAATNALAQEIDARISASTNSSMGSAALEPYAKRTWVEAQGYLKSTNLNGYAQVDWVQNQGFIKKENASGEIARIVDEKIAAQDSTAAYRLMAADGSEWIDGTGVWWRVTSEVEANGCRMSGKPDESAWDDDGSVHSLMIEPNDGDGFIWRYEYMSAWVLADGETITSQHRYEAVTNISSGTVQLRIMEEDDYEMAEGALPAQTIEVRHWMATNAVTRIATTNDVCNIVTNEVTIGYTEWELVGNMNAPNTSDDGAISWEVFFLDGRWWVSVEWYKDGFPYGTTLSVNETEEDANVLTVGPNEYIDGYFRRKRITRNTLGLAMEKDVPTEESITNIARSVVNSVWDAKLGVAWEARMHNGHLYYIAVTNQPPVTGKEE